MKRDEAIEAIRAVRHAISAEHEHNTGRLVRHYQAMERLYRDRMLREPDALVADDAAEGAKPHR